MIRFLNLTDQITEGEKKFAFFDTVTGKIVSFNDDNIFDSWKEFEEAYFRSSFTAESYGFPGTSDLHSLDRLEKLVPEGFFNTNRILTIIESPYAGDVEKNVEYARHCVHNSLLLGEAPIASHLLYTQKGILDDNIPEERRMGIDAGLEWIRVAEQVVYYVDNGWSDGMRASHEYVKTHFPEKRIILRKIFNPF
jgi:hypothetical protein